MKACIVKKITLPVKKGVVTSVVKDNSAICNFLLIATPFPFDHKETNLILFYTLVDRPAISYITNIFK